MSPLTGIFPHLSFNKECICRLIYNQKINILAAALIMFSKHGVLRVQRIISSLFLDRYTHTNVSVDNLVGGFFCAGSWCYNTCETDFVTNV